MESVSKQEKGKVLKAIADLTQKSSFESAVENRKYRIGIWGYRFGQPDKFTQLAA